MNTENTIVEKFTPGPWGVYDFSPATSVYCDDAGGSRVADCDSSLLLPREQMIANAKLIAAAPDMYQALKLVAEYHEHDAAWAEYGSKVMAAIKKATE